MVTHMKRKAMLALLADLPFAMIWPDSWEDIGFTEREIWVNGKGYGYIWTMNCLPSG